MPKLETPKGNIYYHQKGDKNSPVAIGFMNGVMASVSSWLTFEELFVKMGYQVVSFDFMGQLLSDKPEGPYTFDQHIEEARLLYDHLNIKKVHLVGTSYGSEVAMKFALKYPERVSSLTLIDGTAEIDEKMKDVILKWKRDTQLDGDEFFLNMMEDIYHPKYIQDNKDQMMMRAQKLRGQSDYLRGQSILYDTFLNEVHFLDEIHAITCPTLVIVGLQDTLKPPSASLAIHRQIKNSEYISFDECGHVTIFEKEHELKTCLLGFIVKNELR